MKISYNWLKDYIEFDLSPEQIAEILTSTGLETELVTRYESVRGGLKGVLIGEVISCNDHPDASKLKVCMVDVGKPELLNIVCGAPNVAQGQKVPVACVGSEIFPFGKEEGITIQRAKIRGVFSEGMICAEDELGISPAHDGIIVLKKNAVVGSPFSEYLGVYTDSILEIGLTPNRTDAMSHFGVARDLAARLALVSKSEAKLIDPQIGVPPVSQNLFPVSVEIMNNEACKRYTGIVVNNVNVGPSPLWLKNRLLAIGIKPHNNVVDITNYVLHETGHPLHAFDHDMISGGRIVVRNLPEGTPFVTLDGVERRLSETDLMICDAEKPLCIAGVYGGIGSGVTEKTSRVFLESAWFDPVHIRRAARRHGLSTDASFRFERGADPQITVFALQRAVSLLCEIAGAKVCSGMNDEGEYSKRPPVQNVFLRFERLRLLMGKRIVSDELLNILSSLGFDMVEKNDEGLMLNVPTYRADVTREIDVIEEVMRIYGMNNIEIPESIPVSFPVGKEKPEVRLRESIAAFLVNNGFFEVWNNSITSSALHKSAINNMPDVDSQVRLLNPLSQDLDAMRTTLLFGLLENARYNINRKNDSFGLFEFGTTYLKNNDAVNDAGVTERFSEKQVLALIITGKTTVESWYQQQSDAGYYDVKAHVDSILRLAGYRNINYGISDDTNSLLNEGVDCICNGLETAIIGRVQDRVLRIMGLKQPVWYAEIDIPVLSEFYRQLNMKVNPLPKYPDVRRDLSLVIDKHVTFSAVKDVVVSVSPDIIKGVILFDVYETDNLPYGKKSYAIGLVLGDQEKTLEENEIDRVMQSIIAELNTKLGAVLR